MTDPTSDRSAAASEASLGPSLIAEDLLLLLFQPKHGTIAGENTLFYALAGGVLTDLAFEDRVTTESAAKPQGAKVVAKTDRPPTDAILLDAWDYIAQKPRNVQTVLAAIGPPLRKVLIDRLVARGELVESEYKALGLFTTTALAEGTTGRRAALLDGVRDTLLGSGDAEPRSAALAALISASGTLPQFDPEIPWDTPVITRARELEQGNWGAGAAAAAVARTVTATIVNNIIVAAAVTPR